MEESFMEQTNHGNDEPQETPQGSQDVEPTSTASELTKLRRVRLKPGKPLPSGRLNVDKEVLMLRGYVSQSKSGQKAVHFKEVAQLIEAHETSVSSSKQFWEEIGALQETVRGEHKPTSELVGWAMKVDFEAGEANQQLHLLYDRAWFGEIVRQAVNVHKPLKKETLVNILANAAGGERGETEPRARLLVDLLLRTGYITESETEDIEFASGESRARDPTNEPAENPLQDEMAPPRIAPKEREIQLGTISTPGGLSMTLNLTVSEWKVEDVIRLIKYVKTGMDDNSGADKVQAS